MHLGGIDQVHDNHVRAFPEKIHKILHKIHGIKFNNGKHRSGEVCLLQQYYC